VCEGKKSAVPLTFAGHSHRFAQGGGGLMGGAGYSDRHSSRCIPDYLGQTEEGKMYYSGFHQLLDAQQLMGVEVLVCGCVCVSVCMCLCVCVCVCLSLCLCL
jgi:hypothetical protein